MAAMTDFAGVYQDRPIEPTNPKHYRGHKSGIECIDVVRHMSFCQGNAIKYLWRAGDKGALEQDLKKALWYIDDCDMSGLSAVVHNDALDQWLAAEPAGYRRKAILNICLNNLYEAKETIKEWLKA